MFLAGKTISSSLLPHYYLSEGKKLIRGRKSLFFLVCIILSIQIDLSWLARGPWYPDVPPATTRCTFLSLYLFFHGFVMFFDSGLSFNNLSHG